MQEKTNKPALRFKGFDEDWEQRKVSDVANRFDNLRIPVAANLRIPGTTPYYGANGIQDYVEGFTHEGEFVLVAEDGANDLKNYPVKYVNGRIWVNNHAHVLQGKFEILENKFFAYSISQINIEALLVGGGRAKLNAEVMMSLELYIPNFNEQKFIGRYFAQLDQLITLHQRKYTKLVNIKKSMLEKMFPKNGEVVPEIRFAEFTDPWEQRKVSDMFKITRGYVLAVTLTRNNPSAEMPYPVYSSQTKDRGLLGYYKDYLYEEAITWTTDGANAGTVNYRTGKFYCTNVCGVLLSDKVKASKMVAEALNMVTKGYVSYVGNPKLMNNIMADIEIKIPIELKEQEKISKFFEAIDDLITLHQRKLEKLQHIKKACLEKMFV